MFKTCPDPIDVQDLQFKLHCRLKVFDNKELDTFTKSNSLVSCASRYGLLFVGSNNPNLQVIQINCMENYTPKDKDVSNYPRRNVPLPSPPQHVCVNCDSTILAVVTERDGCPCVTFYDVLSFLKQNISIIKEVRLSSTPGIYVKEVGWNPALPWIFTACKSDGTLGVFEIKGASININELPAAAETTCFCWSPKGKQIAVGSKNSRITQYKPDLKAVKVINQPPLEGAHSLISLQWVSNYQFIGIYQSVEPEGSAKLVVVDAPKTGEAMYTNYEDVCYSGTSRLPQFYMVLQQHWNILMVASSNSTELGILGSTGDLWTQWIISDSARAELPLSSDRQETLPIGLALDISSTRPLPWNESTIPPCPYLLILSHHGVLCLFNVVNLKEGVPSICTPPDSVSDLSGVQQFVTPTPIDSTSVSQPTNLKPAPAPALTQAPVFGAKILTQPQPTYAAPATLFGAPKPTESKPLFGGQGTLTPIKPQLTIPQPLFGGQTFITPISKQQTPTTPTVNTAEKYSSIFSALNTPAAIPSPIDSKPVQIIVKPAAPPVEQALTNVTTPVKPAEPIKPTVNLKIKEETDILLAQMLRDETTSLESELKALLHQGRSLNINVGSEDEKIELVTKMESLQEFIKEIVDISVGENAEVHYLKQNLIQSWAWYEEARSRYNASKDETVSLLLRSQPLDSATEKKQANIRRLMYYIESQITQASKALDEQWDNFQDYAKKVHKTKMPTMEAIFQAMVRQNVILQKQSYILKDIAGRLKGKGHTANIPYLYIENTKDLEDDLNRLKIESPHDIHQMQYQRVLKRTKNFTEAKTDKLRKLLKQREVPHVTTVKPQLSSSLMLQSPESKSKRLLSSLAALGTPTPPLSATAPVPKALSFAHSTPIRDTKPVKLTEPPSTTQTFTFKKTEKTNLPATTNTFVPLSKSASVFSNLPQETHAPSAFVPTQVKFSFAPASTTAAVAARPTHKFSAPTTPKTPDAGTTKPSMTQFNFGAGLTVTPVAPNKSAVTTNATGFGTVAMTKPSFTFGGTSNLFGAKVATTEGNSPQLDLSQLNKSLSGSASSGTLGVPGKTANAPKLSAFSAVAASPSSVSLPTTGTLTSQAETKPPVSETDGKPIATSAVTSSNSMKTASLIGNQPVITIPTPTFGTATSKPLSMFQTNTTPTSISEVTSSSTPPLSIPGTVKPSLPFGTPTTTPSVSTVFSGTLLFNVTTSTSTKPSVTPSTSLATSTQSFFFGGAPSTSIVSSGSSPASIFASGTSTAATKPSFFGTATTTPPSSIFATSELPSSGTAVTVADLSVFGVTKTAPGATTQSMFDPAKTSSTQSSIFSTAVTSVQPLTFGSPQSTSNDATKPPVFGTPTAAPQPSIFAPPPVTSELPSDVSQPSVSTTVTVADSPVFGIPKTPTGTAAQSVFDSAKTTATEPSVFSSAITSTQPLTIEGPQSTITVPGTTSQPASTTQSSFFGAPVASTQPSIFGGTTSGVSTITQSTSIFNTGSTVSSTQGSIFGTATPSTKPLFGSSTAAPVFGSTSSTTTQSSIFAVPSTGSGVKPPAYGATPASNQSSIFGMSPAVSTQQGSIFGGGTSTSSAPIFGSTSAPAQTSIFGGMKADSTAKPSVFGAPQTTQSSIFGGNTASSPQSSIFGAPSTTSASPFSSGFSSTATLSPFGQTSPGFGVPKTTASTFSSGFGSPTGFGATASTTSSIFAQPASFGSTSTPAAPTNIFGSATSTFGANSSTNVFGSPVSSAPSSFSFAGTAGNASSTAAFGFGGLNVGSPVTTNSVFGGGATFGQAAVANPFGARTAEQKSPFGTSSTSIFGNVASSSGSVFGSNTGSTFSSNTQGGFGTSSFGSPSNFGQQSTFGQSTFGNTSFGSSQPGPFSGGAGAVAQTGFGSPSSFPKTPGFGSSPVFGGSPQSGFGAAPSFGGAPAFGAAPAFGSPNKIFGGNTPTATFGSASTASAGFGNIANQSTVGFGNLAQQATTPNSAPFSGSSSFSTWR